MAYSFGAIPMSSRSNSSDVASFNAPVPTLPRPPRSFALERLVDEGFFIVPVEQPEAPTVPRAVSASASLVARRFLRLRRLLGRGPATRQQRWIIEVAIFNQRRTGGSRTLFLGCVTGRQVGDRSAGASAIGTTEDRDDEVSRSHVSIP